ncbi:unnamed protein product [Ilex paraguariensis]|uniref:Uncharacterized protein n=1 Tax=Ilex paraguariensis TaxID=185542 RepID=A0ABC8UMQ8_9AQUA
MDEVTTENTVEAPKSRIAIRCAQVSILLSPLKLPRNHRLNSKNGQQERELMLKAEVEDLRRDLLKERVKNKKLRLCSLMEFSVQIILLLSLWTLCLMIAFEFL